MNGSLSGLPRRTSTLVRSALIFAPIIEAIAAVFRDATAGSGPLPRGQH
jgi:hypothetical protein